MSILTDFAERLNDFILESNIDANTLAKTLNIGNSTISRYLHGQHLPDLESLIKIADYFKCPTDYLLGLEEDVYNQQFSPCPPFAERLAFLLEYFNTPSQRVYKNADISKGRFYDWKNGVSSPSVDNLVKLAQFFNCSVDFIIGRAKA